MRVLSMTDAPTRRWATYEEAQAVWTAEFRPISIKTLRRTPLLTKKVGRHRLIDLEHMRTVAKAEIDNAPAVMFAASRGKHNKFGSGGI